ncbi:MAG: ATP-binding protein [Anaerolineae bacterium]|nr:ATP-binding protein [Anaerolineae bacterium]
MKQWVVLSGKGGTGKTSVTAALAHLAARECRLVLADADVDAANLELLLSPTVVEAHDFVGGKVAEIDLARCTACRTCAEVCRFGAVQPGDAYRVDQTACEGCGACSYECPAEAIRMVDRVSGRWFRSETRLGPLFHARLFAGEENSGKLVAQVKQSARYVAWACQAGLLLVDGPPGIGCPVIATTTGADLALLVVEPSVSGVHDLERILGVTRHFGVPAAVCVNKADINPSRTAEVEALCLAGGVPLVGTIPFDTVVTEAMVHRKAVTEYDDGPVSQALRGVWETLRGQFD